jgi:hypothetical protein
MSRTGPCSSSSRYKIKKNNNYAQLVGESVSEVNWVRLWRGSDVTERSPSHGRLKGETRKYISIVFAQIRQGGGTTALWGTVECEGRAMMTKCGCHCVSPGMQTTATMNDCVWIGSARQLTARLWSCISSVKVHRGRHQRKKMLYL